MADLHPSPRSTASARAAGPTADASTLIKSSVSKGAAKGRSAPNKCACTGGGRGGAVPDRPDRSSEYDLRRSRTVNWSGSGLPPCGPNRITSRQTWQPPLSVRFTSLLPPAFWPARPGGATKSFARNATTRRALYPLYDGARPFPTVGAGRFRFAVQNEFPGAMCTSIASR